VEVEALSEEATVLLVRKGEGPWIFVGDRERDVGSSPGAPRKDGLTLTGFEPPSKSPSAKPADLKAADILVVVDQASLEVGVVELR